MPEAVTSGCTVIPGADSTTQIKLPTTAAWTAAASGSNLLAGVGSMKHRLFLLTITVDTTGLVTLSDFTNLKMYMVANSSCTFDFQSVGALQTTANTNLTITNSGGGNFTAAVTYRDE